MNYSGGDVMAGEILWIDEVRDCQCVERKEAFRTENRLPELKPGALNERQARHRVLRVAREYEDLLG
jgi:hypothetical protein